jgi:hypothetical protein
MAQEYTASPLDPATKISQFVSTFNAEIDDLTAIFSETASFSLTHGGFYKVNATSGAVTVTLPAASSNTGMRVCIKKTDSSANAVTIDGNGSETIDGAATKALTSQYDFSCLVCDGTEWFIVGG